MRWAWIGLAIVLTVGYLWINPLITIVRLQDEESENLEGTDVDVDDLLMDMDTVEIALVNPEEFAK